PTKRANQRIPFTISGKGPDNPTHQSTKGQFQQQVAYVGSTRGTTKRTCAFTSQSEVSNNISQAYSDLKGIESKGTYGIQAITYNSIQ
ncbi:unnamed protein product, partial [Musa banksii]